MRAALVLGVGLLTACCGAPPLAVTTTVTVSGPPTATVTATPRTATRTRPTIVPVPPATPPVTVQPLAEDDPGWNCLTMGNHRCGPDWVPVTQALGDALSEGSDLPWTYPWESCLVRYGDTTVVVCPDGQVVVS